MCSWRLAFVRVGAHFDRRTIGADAAATRADGLVRTAFIAWNEPPGSIAIGQRLEAILERPARIVETRVPRSAVKIRDGLALVNVSNGLFPREQPVRLGAADDAWVEVIGVADGARVVVCLPTAFKNESSRSITPRVQGHHGVRLGSHIEHFSVRRWQRVRWNRHVRRFTIERHRRGVGRQHGAVVSRVVGPVDRIVRR
jgi:hypothetical protein